MIDELGVRQIDNWQLFLFGGIVLLAASVWIEVARKDKKQILSRIAALCLAIISVIFIALKPFYLKRNEGHLTVILTEGSNKKDSLMIIHPKASFIKWSDTVQSKHLSTNVIIDGFGIPQYDLWKVDKLNVQYIRNELPTGIINISYPQKVELGEEVEVRFKVNNAVGHKFVLQGLGEQYDSLTVSKDQEIIKLGCKLKAVGMYVLTLSQFDANAQLANVESIPIIVYPAKKFDILLINAFPTFESRFLKQFLETSDHNYFIRNQISTDKYRYESNGSTLSELKRLTEAKLKLFDVVIINASQLASLSSNEKSNLANAVRNDGLGLLLLAGKDDLVKKLPDWVNAKFNTVKNELFVLPFEDETLELQTSSYRFIPNAMSETIYRDDKGGVVTGMPYGLGKYTFSAFTNTYELVLSGNEKGYQNLWKALIESCLKPQGKQWSINNKLNYQNQPMKFVVNSDSLTRIIYEGAEIAMKRNMLVNDKWEGQLWPNHSGWNYLDMNEPELNRVWFYTHKETAFKSLNLASRIEANSRMERMGDHFSKATVEKQVDISLWWFYMIFVLSVAYLWIQPKLR